MSDSSGSEPTAQDGTDHDPTDQDVTGLSEEQLDEVAGGINMFQVGWPQCSTCGKKHDPMDWSACTR